MAVKTLAVKYRPKTWDEVSEQSSTKIILQQQLQSGEIKNAYLFTLYILRAKRVPYYFDK